MGDIASVLLSDISFGETSISRMSFPIYGSAKFRVFMAHNNARDTKFREMLVRNGRSSNDESDERRMKPADSTS